MWLVNRSPLRCIPSGNGRRLLESFALMMHFHRTFAAVGSFTVMMHSLRKVDYGRSFVHHSQRRLYGWSIVHRGDAFPAIDHVRLHGDLFTDGTIPRGNSFSGRILAKLTGSLILLSARQFFFRRSQLHHSGRFNKKSRCTENFAQFPNVQDRSLAKVNSSWTIVFRYHAFPEGSHHSPEAKSTEIVHLLELSYTFPKEVNSSCTMIHFYLSAHFNAETQCTDDLCNLPKEDQL